MGYYAELRWQGIEVDANNDTNPDNTPQTNNITITAYTELNWTEAEGIVLPILARNLPVTP